MGKRKQKNSSFWLRVVKPRFVLIALLIVYCQDKNVTVRAIGIIPSNGLRLRAPNSLQDFVDKLKPEQSHEEGEAAHCVENQKFLSEARKKRNCGLPAIAARALINPSVKKSYLALTSDEIFQKEEEERNRNREVKRNGFLGNGPLPWTCETEYKWKDMGPEHYPRFVRTAECKKRLCFNGFFRCKPRRYKTKILRRLTGTEAASCEDDDVSLPESLRNHWKFITVTINLCCDCVGSLPALDSPRN